MNPLRELAWRIAQRTANERGMRGWTQAQLASRSGIQRANIARIEQA